MSDTNMGVGQYYDSPEEKQITKLLAVVSELRTDNERLKRELKEANQTIHYGIHQFICVHHTDSERQAIVSNHCPCCLTSQLATTIAERDEMRVRLEQTKISAFNDGMNNAANMVEGQIFQSDFSFEHTDSEKKMADKIRRHLLPMATKTQGGGL